MAKTNPSEDLSGVYLLGGIPLTQHLLLPSREGIREIGFSPNEKWFAYQKFNDSTASVLNSKLKLVSDNKQTLTITLPFDNQNGYAWFGSWISDELMLIIFSNDNSLSQSFMIFNPFSEEVISGVLDKLSGWEKNTTPYFSPDMTRVVFFRSQPQKTVVLWDLIQNTELWSSNFISDVNFYELGLGSMSGFNQSIIWLPNSEGFVYSSWDQNQYASFYKNRNQDSERIILQSDKPQDGIIFEGVSSPNSQYIAYINDFFNSSTNAWYQKITLYDFVSNDTYELCSELQNIEEVLWSPDSQNLVFKQQYDSTYRLLMINVYSGKVFTLLDIHNFLGSKWLSNELWLK